MELSTVFDAFRHGTCTVIVRSADGYELTTTGQLRDIGLSGNASAANISDAVTTLSLRLDAAEVNIDVPVHA